jgi:hypothetical protein
LLVVVGLLYLRLQLNTLWLLEAVAAAVAVAVAAVLVDF